MISGLRKQIARAVALLVTVLTLGRIKVDTSGQPSDGAEGGPDQQGIGRLHRDQRPEAPGATVRKARPGAPPGARG